MRTMWTDGGAGPTSVTTGMQVNPNFALYGAFPLSENLWVQAELNFMINQGYRLTVSDRSGTDTDTITYTSLDLPILLKYELGQDEIIWGFLAGPHFSIPLGNARVSGDGLSENFNIRSFATFGVTAGAFAKYPLGNGYIVGDARFIFDFNAVEAREYFFTVDFMRRRALAFSVGYEISF